MSCCCPQNLALRCLKLLKLRSGSNTDYLVGNFMQITNQKKPLKNLTFKYQLGCFF